MPKLIASIMSPGADGPVQGGEGVIGYDGTDIVGKNADVTRNLKDNDGDHAMDIEDRMDGGGTELVTAIREGVKNIAIKQIEYAEVFKELDDNSDPIDNDETGQEESGDVRRNGGNFFTEHGDFGPIGEERRKNIKANLEGTPKSAPVGGTETPPWDGQEHTASSDTFSGTQSVTSPNHENSTRTVSPHTPNLAPRRFFRVWRASPSAKTGSTGATSLEFHSSANNSHTSSTEQETQQSKNNPKWSPAKREPKVPIPSMVTALGNSFDLPILYVSPSGAISIILNMGVVIEIASDRAVRLVCHDKFSAACNGSGTLASLLHKKARIYQKEEKVYCNFSSSTCPSSKCAVITPEGVLFTMLHLADAYLVSTSAIEGTTVVPSALLQFPNLNYDFTLRLFYADCETGEQYVDVCHEIVKTAHYGSRSDASLLLTVNDIYIKQDANGNCEVNCRPRHITCSPTEGTIRVRTDNVDMAVQDNEKAYVKSGLKRVHVSRSGMVASDGSFVTSMDHLGRIVSPN